MIGSIHRTMEKIVELELGTILDVTPEGFERFDRKLLEGSDHPVLTCRGPGEDVDCPLLADGQCEKVQQAHGIVFKLDLDEEEHRLILREYKRTLPDEAPIGAAVELGQAEQYAELLEGVHVWIHQPTAAELDGFAALVEAADRGR